MLISELIIYARDDYLDDVPEVDKLWDDAFMLRAFTEAQRQACNRTDFLFEALPVTLLLGESSCVLNPRITRLCAVLWQGRPLKKTSVAEQDYRSGYWRDPAVFNNHWPCYYVRGNQIFFTSALAIEQSGFPITLECYVLPEAGFTDVDDEPVIPEEFHRDLVLWVLYEALSKRDADTFDIKAKYYFDQFEAVFGKYVSAQVRQHQLENGLPMALTPTNYNRNARRLYHDENW